MPAWWPRKSKKSKSEDSLPASPHSNPISPFVKPKAAVVGRDIVNHHQLQGAVGSGGFSGFDSDGREGIGLPLPRPSISSTHSYGIENGSSSVSSVSSSGSGDDHHQLDPVRRPPDIKFNARSRSPGPASRGPTSPTSPHTRFACMSLEAPTGRQEEFRSESHPLPLPPSSPTGTSPSALSYMKSPMVETNPICASSKWKKGKLLGKGTFGNVYIGFNSETGNMCAIKEVRVASDDRSFKECLKQLHQEINLLSQLSHPNIVQYYGSEFDEDTLSVFLEYVSGGSIHKLLQEYGAFKEPVIQNYTRQIVHGLAYLHGLASTHGKSVVHRDIKGANILVDPNGDIKLADFGMAKHIANCTTVLSFKGSPYWMAPEVIMNNGYGYNTAVDIWSLGCTILEMATSKPPWSQYEGVAAIFKIGNSKDVPNIPEHLSTEAKSFIRLCLQREPSARPTASQLLDHPFIREQTNNRVSNGNTNIGITKDPYTSSPFDGSQMWLSAMKSLPLASQEASGAIEAYHLKLKTKLFDDSHLGALQRVDWLVHKLMTELHSSYWLDRSADETNSFQHVKEEYIASTSWHRAQQIPDSSVTIDEKDKLFAKVVSQKDSSKTHLVWNPGSEFGFCDCAWSMQGNLCKHVIKVNMVCKKPSLSLQSFKEILLNMWKEPMDDSISLDQSMAWTQQMLDQIQKLVELKNSEDISNVVNKLPVKWETKGARTSMGVPSSACYPKNSEKDIALRRKNRKRRRLSRLT